MVWWGATTEAGEMCIIYDRDASGRIFEKFVGNPGVTFCTNGLLFEDAENNQGGLTDDPDTFWPYSLYRCTSPTGKYERLCSVDAWAKSYRATDYSGNPFPSSVDTSNTGYVYYVSTPGSGSTQPLDYTDYIQKVRSMTGIFQIIKDITYYYLTIQNVKNYCTETAPAAQTASYADALESIYYNQELCGETFEPIGSVQENQFAVCDVNGDGQEELLVRWSSATSEDTREAIFGRDASGNLFYMGEAFPSEGYGTQSYLTKYYSNGTAFAAWTTDRFGMSGGKFWPFTLYQYNPATQTYEFQFSVRAWSLSYSAKDPDRNLTYPYSADTSGTGMVYYITTMSNGDYVGGDIPRDETEFQALLAQYTQGAEAIQPAYQMLNEGNIQALREQEIAAATEPVPTETQPVVEEPTQNQTEGDVNGNGAVNAEDAAEILIFAAARGAGESYESETFHPEFADVDGNGIIDAADATNVLIYAATVGSEGSAEW